MPFKPNLSSTPSKQWHKKQRRIVMSYRTPEETLPWSRKKNVPSISIEEKIVVNLIGKEALKSLSILGTNSHVSTISGNSICLIKNPIQTLKQIR